MSEGQEGKEEAERRKEEKGCATAARNAMKHLLPNSIGRGAWPGTWRPWLPKRNSY